MAACYKQTHRTNSDVDRYGRTGLVVGCFLLNLWKHDYCRRSAASSNPCALVVRYINGQLCGDDALALFGAQCVGVAAGFQVYQSA